MRLRTPRPAYSLMEVVLVLALIVILASMTLPSVEAMFADARVQAGVDAVRAAWSQARARAMDESRPYRFALVNGQGNYRVAPVGADYWQGGGDGAPTPTTETDTPALVIDEVLPKGVFFTTVESYQAGGLGSDVDVPAGSVDPSTWEPTITFLPNGTTREDVQLVLQTTGCRPAFLRLRSLTGVVSVSRAVP